MDPGTWLQRHQLRHVPVSPGCEPRDLPSDRLAGLIEKWGQSKYRIDRARNWINW
jgi:hypothetical protein